MNSLPSKVSALAVATAIGVTACSNMTPGENAAVFGTGGGLAAGSIARAAGMSTSESIATGVAAGAIIGATTYIIAKHEASERQRRVAEQRARVVYARMQTRERHEVATHPGKRARKTPRYIAVDTVRDEHTSPRAQKAVMIWDTQSEQVVGHDVYDVQTPPPVGSTARFETYSAEYVGGGS